MHEWSRTFSGPLGQRFKPVLGCHVFPLDPRRTRGYPARRRDLLAGQNTSETVDSEWRLTGKSRACVKPVTILLIEDNPGDTRLVEEALKSCTVPIELTVATDGEAALSVLRKEEAKPDLIILDLNI